MAIGRKATWSLIGLAVVAILLAASLERSSVLGIWQSDTATNTVVGVGTASVLPDLPVRLTIPSIGVDAKIQQVGIRTNGAMGIPTNFTDVAWYKDGPRPGSLGSAVIDGHVDGVKVARAVFYDLNKLEAGDKVQVTDAAGQTFNFVVREKRDYKETDSVPEVFQGTDGKAHLNLITCIGDWQPAVHRYTDRIVIFTDLVE